MGRVLFSLIVLFRLFANSLPAPASTITIINPNVAIVVDRQAEKLVHIEWQTDGDIDSVRIFLEDIDNNNTIEIEPRYFNRGEYHFVYPRESSVTRNFRIRIENLADETVFDTSADIQIQAAEQTIYTWVGSISDDWSNILNWQENGLTAAQLPTDDDIVLIPQGTSFNPKFISSVTLKELHIEKNTRVDVATFELIISSMLNNKGDLVGDLENGNLRFSGPNPFDFGHWGGNGKIFIHTRIDMHLTLIHDHYLTQSLVVGTTPEKEVTFTLHKHKLLVEKDFQTVASGSLHMSEPYDHLIVFNDLIFSGGDSFLYTGTIDLKGNLTQFGNPTAVQAGSFSTQSENFGPFLDEHHLIFSGTERQFVFFESVHQSSVFHVFLDNPNGLETGANPFHINGGFVANNGEVNGEYIEVLGDVIDNGNTGKFQLNTFVLKGDNTLIPDTLGSRLILFSAMQSLQHPLRLKGTLILSDTSLLEIGSHHLELWNGLELNTQSKLKMNDPEGIIRVHNADIIFNNAGISEFFQGRLQFKGNFQQYSNLQQFGALNSFTFEMFGENHQEIKLENPADNRFTNLTIVKPTGDIELQSDVFIDAFFELRNEFFSPVIGHGNRLVLKDALIVRSHLDSLELQFVQPENVILNHIEILNDIEKTPLSFTSSQEFNAVFQGIKYINPPLNGKYLSFDIPSGELKILGYDTPSDPRLNTEQRNGGIAIWNNGPLAFANRDSSYYFDGYFSKIWKKDDELSRPDVFEHPDSLTIESWVLIPQLETNEAYFKTIVSRSGYSESNASQISYGFAVEKPEGNAQDVHFVYILDTEAGVETSAFQIPHSEKVNYEGQWVHLAGSYHREKQRMRFYINGQLVEDRVVNSSVKTGNGSGFFIGSTGVYEPESTLFGLVSEVRLWNYERSIDEITFHMDKEFTEVPQELVGYWKLDHIKNGMIQDFSAYENHLFYNAENGVNASPKKSDQFALAPRFYTEGFEYEAFQNQLYIQVFHLVGYPRPSITGNTFFTIENKYSYSKIFGTPTAAELGHGTHTIQADNSEGTAEVHYSIFVHERESQQFFIGNPNLNVSITNRGTIEEPFGGFAGHFKNNEALKFASPLFYHAGNVVGYSSKNTDFAIISEIRGGGQQKFQDFQDIHQTEFTDGRSLNPLNIEVSQRVHISHSNVHPQIQQIVFIEYDVFNNSGSDLTDFRFAYSNLWGLGSEQDIVSRNEEFGALIWADASSNRSDIYGTLFLSDPVEHYNVIQAHTPRETDAERNEDITATQTIPTNPDTYKGIQSTPAVSIKNGERRTFTIAMIMAENETAFSGAARYAKTLFEESKNQPVLFPAFPYPGYIGSLGNDVMFDLVYPKDQLPDLERLREDIKHAAHLSNSDGLLYPVDRIDIYDGTDRQTVHLFFDEHMRQSTHFSFVLDSTLRDKNGKSLGEIAFNFSSNGRWGFDGHYERTRTLPFELSFPKESILKFQSIFIESRFGIEPLLGVFFTEDNKLKLQLLNLFDKENPFRPISSQLTLLDDISAGLKLHKLTQFNLSKGRQPELILEFTLGSIPTILGVRIESDFTIDPPFDGYPLIKQPLFSYENAQDMSASFITADPLIDLTYFDQNTNRLQVLVNYDYETMLSSGNQIIYQAPANTTKFKYILNNDLSGRSAIIYNGTSSTDSLYEIKFHSGTFNREQAVGVSIDHATIGDIVAIHHLTDNKRDPLLNENESTELIIEGIKGFERYELLETPVRKETVSLKTQVTPFQYFALSDAPFFQHILQDDTQLIIGNSLTNEAIDTIRTTYPTTFIPFQDARVMITLNADNEFEIYEPKFRRGNTKFVKPGEFVDAVQNAEIGDELILVPADDGSKIFRLDSLRINKALFIRGAEKGIILAPKDTSIAEFVRIDFADYGELSNLTLRGHETERATGIGLAVLYKSHEFITDSLTIEQFKIGANVYNGFLDLSNVRFKNNLIGIQGEFKADTLIRDGFHTSINLHNIHFENNLQHAVVTKNIQNIEIYHSLFTNTHPVHGVSLKHSYDISSIETNENEETHARVKVESSKFSGLNEGVFYMEKNTDAIHHLDFNFHKNTVENIRLNTSASVIELLQADGGFSAMNVFKNIDAPLFKFDQIGNDTLFLINNVFENILETQSGVVIENKSSSDSLLLVFNSPFINTAPEKAFSNTGSGKLFYGFLGFTESIQPTDSINWGLEAGRPYFSTVYSDVAFHFTENYAHEPGSFGIDLGLRDNRLLDADGSVSNIGRFAGFDEKFGLSENIVIGFNVNFTAIEWQAFTQLRNVEALEAYYIFTGNDSLFIPTQENMTRVNHTLFSHPFERDTTDYYITLAANHSQFGVNSYSNKLFIPATFQIKEELYTKISRPNQRDSILIPIKNYSEKKQGIEIKVTSLSGKVEAAENVQLHPGENVFPIYMDKSLEENKGNDARAKIHFLDHGHVIDSVVVLFKNDRGVNFLSHENHTVLRKNKQLQKSYDLQNPDGFSRKIDLRYLMFSEQEKQWLKGPETIMINESETSLSGVFQLNSTNIANPPFNLEGQIIISENETAYDTLQIVLTVDQGVEFEYQHVEKTLPFGLEINKTMQLFNKSPLKRKLKLVYQIEKPEFKWFRGDSVFSFTEAENAKNITFQISTKHVSAETKTLNAKVVLSDSVSALDTLTIKIHLDKGVRFTERKRTGVLEFNQTYTFPLEISNGSSIDRDLTFEYIPLVLTNNTWLSGDSTKFISKSKLLDTTYVNLHTHLPDTTRFLRAFVKFKDETFSQDSMRLEFEIDHGVQFSNSELRETQPINSQFETQLLIHNRSHFNRNIHLKMDPKSKWLTTDTLFSIHKDSSVHRLSVKINTNNLLATQQKLQTRLFLIEKNRVRDTLNVEIKIDRGVFFLQESFAQTLYKKTIRTVQLKLENRTPLKRELTLEYLQGNQTNTWLDGEKTLSIPENQTLDTLEIRLQNSVLPDSIDTVKGQIVLKHFGKPIDTLHVVLTIDYGVQFTNRDISQTISYDTDVNGVVTYKNLSPIGRQLNIRYLMQNEADKNWLTGQGTDKSRNEKGVDSIQIKISSLKIPESTTELKGSIYLYDQLRVYDSLFIRLKLEKEDINDNFVQISESLRDLRKKTNILEAAGIVLKWKAKGTKFLVQTEIKEGDNFQLLHIDTLVNQYNYPVNNRENKTYRFVIHDLTDSFHPASDTIDFKFKPKAMRLGKGFWQLVTSNIKSEAGNLTNSLIPEYQGPIYSWDRSLNDYVDVRGKALNDFKAYWIKPKKDIEFTYQKSSYTGKESNLIVSLKQGWNQVGNPWDWAILWKHQEIKVNGAFVSVQHEQTAALELDAYHYVTNENAILDNFPYDSTYTHQPIEFSDNDESFIRSRKGVWIYVNKDTELKFKNIQVDAQVNPAKTALKSSVELSLTEKEYRSKLFFNYTQTSPQKRHHYKPPVFNANESFHLKINNAQLMGITDAHPQSNEVKEYTFKISGARNEEKKLNLDIENETGIYVWFYQISSGNPIEITDKSELKLKLKHSSETVKLYVTTDASFKPAIIPTTFKLHQNYPNPFNPTTTILVDIPFHEEISHFKTMIIVYNILGQRIKTVYQGFLPAAQHLFTWDGTNNVNSKVSSGVYFYQIRAGRYVQSKKMVLIK